jgi:glycerol kinase
VPAITTGAHFWIMPPDGNGPLYLALDQGGHASRALVFDSRGATVARALREVREFQPQPDWVEQDPDELVGSLTEAIREVEREIGDRAKHIAAAGLATQRSSIVCWDRISGDALSPVLSWQDRRAHEWLAHFAPHAGAIHATTGLMLSAHYGASKLRWCLDHLPRVAAAAADKRLAMGPLASFLAFRLTEERALVTDPANAARTLLWNLETFDWDPGLLHLFDIPRALLPDCVPTRFGFGRLAGGHRPPLTLVTGDQSAALFAYGTPRAANAYVNIGTGAFVQRIAGAAPGRPPRLLTGIVLRDTGETVYTLEGTVNGAGAALAWAEAELGLENVAERLAEWLERAGEPPLFLNGVGGLGAPFWVADFESRFVGEAEPEQKIVAVAESIVFLVQANLDEFRKLAAPLEGIIASGGLAGVDALCQRLSDLSGLPLHRPVEHEATARGLAWLLAGKPRDWPEPDFGAWFKPRANAGLRARYGRWRARMEEATGY